MNIQHALRFNQPVPDVFDESVELPHSVSVKKTPLGCFHKRLRLVDGVRYQLKALVGLNVALHQALEDRKGDNLILHSVVNGRH